MRKLFSILLAGVLVLVMVGCVGEPAENSVEKLRKDIVGEWEDENGNVFEFTENGQYLFGVDTSLIVRYRILEDKSLEITEEVEGDGTTAKWINKDEIQDDKRQENFWCLDGNELFTKEGGNILSAKKR